MTEIETRRESLSASRRAVFFGGAGMSTESGIPDFRSAGKKDASRWLYRIYQCFLYFYRRHCPNHADPPPHTAIETQSEVHPCPSKKSMR